MLKLFLCYLSYRTPSSENETKLKIKQMNEIKGNAPYIPIHEFKSECILCPFPDCTQQFKPKETIS